jgi:hypothetical protein
MIVVAFIRHLLWRTTVSVPDPTSLVEVVKEIGGYGSTLA